MDGDIQKQSAKPLFPKILWERPINKRAAKSLLIIGGHATQFSATQLAYQEALAAGIGEAKVVLPDSVLKLTGHSNLPDCLFVPSNNSGAMAKAALEEILVYAGESDGILLAGELSENAETVSMLEGLVEQVKNPLAMTDEVIKSLLFATGKLIGGKNRLLITTMQTFIKLAEKLEMEITIQPGQSLFNKVEFLQTLANQTGLDLVLGGAETVVASNGKVSVTPTAKAGDLLGSGLISTFWLQHSGKFEALTTAAYIISQINSTNDLKNILAEPL